MPHTTEIYLDTCLEKNCTNWSVPRSRHIYNYLDLDRLHEVWYPSVSRIIDRYYWKYSGMHDDSWKSTKRICSWLWFFFFTLINWRRKLCFSRAYIACRCVLRPRKSQMVLHIQKFLLTNFYLLSWRNIYQTFFLITNVKSTFDHTFIYIYICMNAFVAFIWCFVVIIVIFFFFVI